MTPPMADMDKDCMGYALCPDALTDAKKAMASVNGKMVVKSSHDAILVPMWLDPAPNGVGVTGGMDNMPFANVDWKAMQSDVVGMGVTFKATRVSVGAGQEAVPESEVMHITCGPFRCSEASMTKPMAPEISAADSAVCAAWDPDMELQVGMIDNDAYQQNARFAGPPLAFKANNPQHWYEDNGVDVGWVSSSQAAMTVKHVFSGNTPYSVKGPNSAKGTDKPLEVGMKDNQSYSPGLQIEKITGITRTAVRSTITDLSEACRPATAYSSTASGVFRPDKCFRVRVAEDAEVALGPGMPGGARRIMNYLDAYSVEVSPEDSLVWGKVAWKDGALKDLACPSMSFPAADQVDVCELFEEEVDQALASGWGDVTLKTRTRPGATAKDVLRNSISSSSNAAAMDAGTVIAQWEALPKEAKSRRFKRLYFDDNLNGKLIDGPNQTLYGVVLGTSNPGATSTLDAVLSDLYGRAKTRAMHNLYGYETLLNRLNINFIWMPLMDGDGDPTMGDFGKVDLFGADSDATASGNDKKAPDGKADNYPSPDDANMCSDADGKGCDASWEMDYDVLFGDGIFGCETTRTVTISCEWDAQGMMKANPPDNLNGNLAATGNLANFAKCTAK